MVTRSVRPVRFEMYKCDPTEGSAILLEHGVLARVRRAAVALAAAWGAALFCVFIPLVHFVAVPSLLLTGLGLGAYRLFQRRSLQELRGNCPRCARPFVVRDGRLSDGREIPCDGCEKVMVLGVSP